jgi:hypothetical protein
MPVTLAPDFASIQDKDAQWKVFILKSRLDYAPATFGEVATAVSVFMKPVVDSLLDGKDMKRDWIPSAGWEKQA